MAKTYKPKVICVVGTRPEGTKVAPVLKELRKYSDKVDSILVSSGQHREMLVQALAPFGLVPDIDLDVMQHGQTLAQLTSRICTGLDQILESEMPDVILGQGDTTTCFTSSMISFYRQISFGHIEAGLRTESVLLPFPEEFNRRAVSLTAKWHFAPTEWAKQNLLREGIDSQSIFVTGNTSIDAALSLSEGQLKQEFRIPDGMRQILVTTHRRENWGEPQLRIARAIKRIIEKVPDAFVLVAMHRNPAVRETLTSVLAGVDRVRLIEPPDYEEFVPVMKQSYLILTDSGGIQEEAPALGVPVLILREETERPEGVDAGRSKLVGTDEDTIYQEAIAILQSSALREQMALGENPYGDGKAAQRIRFHLLASLGIDSPTVGHESCF